MSSTRQPLGSPASLALDRVNRRCTLQRRNVAKAVQPVRDRPAPHHGRQRNSRGHYQRYSSA